MAGNARRVLLINPGPRMVEAARTVGVEAWVIRDVGPDPYGAGCPWVRQLVVDTEDADAVRSLLVDCGSRYGIEHILYFGGSEALHLAVEGALADLSPRQGDALRRLGDPVAMRRLLNESGVSVVTAELVESAELVRAMTGRMKLPWVVRSGGDPKGAMVRDHAELEALTADARGGPYLVEEFLDGPAVSVQTLTCAGMHEVIGMTEVRGAASSGADLLHPAALSAVDGARVRATVRSLLDLAGYEAGLARTQVVLTERGPRIASSGTRPVDLPVTLVTRAATGRDPEHHILSVLAGRPPREPVATRFALLSRLAPPDDATWTPVGPDRLRDLAHVHEARVLDGAADPGGRGVQVVVTGASPEEAAEHLRAVRRRWESGHGNRDVAREALRPGGRHAAGTG
ncbi:acetyl-CoA carboxylase biotin carboxylase subunit family protein [Streptomyces sp. NPDC056600]|uniref:ATP-grasp domain-containing protein n=1 Tax=Streptomyces sp. NPDC056600 TaxID=3345874 RepID=UPI0036AF6DE0